VKRRGFIALLGGAAAWPLVARTQQADIHSIGVLTLTSPNPEPLIAALREGLRDAGYAEGRNLRLDIRTAEAKPDLQLAQAVELVRLKVDLIVTFFTPTALAAKQATREIPVVMAGAGDPVATGLVASLARPGGNVTGLTSQASDILGKRLQILAQLIPADHAVAVVLNPDTPFSALAVHELRTAARGRRFDIFEARTAEQVSAGIEAAAQSGAGGLLTLEDFLILSVGRQIVDLAAKVRLPTVFGSRDLAEAGGLISYGTDRRQLHRRAADYVDRILKGAKPADLPVEQPSKFEFVINLKTARSLGLEVPPSLLALADEVIE
jgi:putative ABC transport system substrate-binding protein